jgi:hypothetical protein
LHQTERSWTYFLWDDSINTLEWQQTIDDGVTQKKASLLFWNMKRVERDKKRLYCAVERSQTANVGAAANLAKATQPPSCTPWVLEMYDSQMAKRRNEMQV